MGASSVTGVGPGSAEGATKGRDVASIGVNKLIGPHHVVAGSVTLSGGTATVLTNVPTASTSDYVIMLTDMTANHSAGVTAFTIETDTQTTVGSSALLSNTSQTMTSYDASFTIVGNSTDVIAYAVIKTGHA